MPLCTESFGDYRQSPLLKRILAHFVVYFKEERRVFFEQRYFIECL